MNDFEDHEGQFVYIKEEIEDIKEESDVDVKDEPLESCNENLCKDDDVNYNLISYGNKINVGNMKKNFISEGRTNECSSPLSTNSVGLEIFLRTNTDENEMENGNNHVESEVSYQLNLVDKRFKCSLCNYQSEAKGNFRRHLLTHSNAKLLKCSECDYECNRRGQLKIHLLTHSNRKLFKCPKCDYECNQKGHLNIHLLTHSKEKLLKCSECDYECNLKAHLERHYLIHSNLKLLQCPHCKYNTNHKSNLKRHSLTHLKKQLKKDTNI